MVIVDLYSGWPSVHQVKTTESWKFIGLLRDHCKTSGVPEELASDQTQQFLCTWGIKHRLSSAYNPHGNLRAEVRVKVMKRFI